jgi:hypothetical protein
VLHASRGGHSVQVQRGRGNPAIGHNLVRTFMHLLFFLSSCSLEYAPRSSVVVGCNTFAAAVLPPFCAMIRILFEARPFFWRVPCAT